MRKPKNEYPNYIYTIYDINSKLYTAIIKQTISMIKFIMIIVNNNIC